MEQGRPGRDYRVRKRLSKSHVLQQHLTHAVMDIAIDKICVTHTHTYTRL